MRSYLLHLETNTYKDSGFHVNRPPAPNGFQWVEGYPENIERYQPIPIEKKLNQGLDELLNKIPDDKFLAYSSDLANVYAFLQAGQVDLAKRYIEIRPFPAEDMAIKHSILALLTGG